MDRGRLLAEAANVLVHVAGGPGMTLSEVEILMQELERHVGDDTQILFGTAVDNRMGNRMTVTLISSLAADGEPAQQPLWAAPQVAPQPKPAPRPAAPVPTAPAPAEAIETCEETTPEPPMETLQTIEASVGVSEVLSELLDRNEVEREPEEPVAQSPREPMAELVQPEPQPPRVILPTKSKPAPPKEAKPVEKIVHARQEVLQFESVTRGRFEKSEPTIVEGQDLDVPTFLRKNVRVK